MLSFCFGCLITILTSFFFYFLPVFCLPSINVPFTSTAWGKHYGNIIRVRTPAGRQGWFATRLKRKEGNRSGIIDCLSVEPHFTQSVTSSSLRKRRILHDKAVRKCTGTSQRSLKGHLRFILQFLEMKSVSAANNKPERTVFLGSLCQRTLVLQPYAAPNVLP